jgi:hypothetical protein
MGVVYEAFDRERKQSVALKTIRSVDAQAIYYLKREFRAIADVVHPNLVKLHELVFDGGHWFFTMDLIEGRDFLTHVRGGGPASAHVETQRPDPAALRPALAQLVMGVTALHDRGKLHRDIKPSNALVSRDGRVVLMDFGLLVEPNVPDPYRTFDRGLVGTPAYLAPEQALMPAQTSTASDWYSVGVLLYEALTGQVPYLSECRSLAELVAAKQRHPPPPPSKLAQNVPADLEALCMDLLSIDDEQRPTGAEILRRLGAGPALPSKAPAAPGASRGAALLVGRDAQLAKLEEAFGYCRRGQAVVAFIDGSSGAGKTALLDHFAGLLAERGEAVVISGRCLERELLPYRALDNLVDTLTRYLVSLPTHEVDALLPRDIQALARLFPVLRRVPAIGGARRRAEVTPDPQELRQRAFGAMRDLLGRIADRRPLVLCIDDLQWGDVDSATLIRAVLRAPAPPPIMAIASYRSEDAKESACLQVLLDLALQGEDGPERARRFFIGVDTLGGDDAQKLARALLAERDDANRAAETIAKESGGNPLLLHQLVEYLNGQPGAELAPAAREVTLDDVLRARVRDLPPNARALLEVVAVAGRPIALEIGNEVAGLPIGDREAISTLRAQRLARTKDGERTIEIVHDRIRQSVAAQIAPDTVARCHFRLAIALEGRPEVDPEILAFHFFGGGDVERASEYAAAAAERADQALAFERAARLYRWAFDLRAPKDDGATTGPASADARTLLVKMGDALANAGKGAAAAAAYLEAARGAASNDELEYQRRAAEQYLKSGHIDESMEILRTTLAAFGVQMARTPRRALSSLLLRRALLALRGLRSRERDSSLVTARELTRLDVLWSLAGGFGIVDTIRAADLQTRHMLLALKIGDPYRISRALTFEAAFSATPGKRAHRRTRRLVKLAEEIAARVNQPHTDGWAVLGRGMAAYLEGEHRAARVDCERAEEIFSSNCTGVAHEINIARLFGLFSMFNLGEFGELSRRVPRLLKEAEDNGDLYLATSLQTGLPNSCWLAADDPEGARQQVAEGMRRWTKRSFHNQHYFNMSADAHIDIYRGDPQAARARVLADWPKLKSSLILRIQTTRAQALFVRGRATLALAATVKGTERQALLAAVETDARLLQKEGLAGTVPQAVLLRAGIKALSGDPTETRALLERAAAGFDAAGMKAYASASRRRLGALLGGDEGRALVDRENAWQRGEAIRNCDRFTALLAPGFDAATA